MQYTLRNIPKNMDRALRRRAKAEGKTVQQVAMDLIRAGVRKPAPRFSIEDMKAKGIIGSWVEDPEFDRMMEWQDRIHPDDWK